MKVELGWFQHRLDEPVEDEMSSIIISAAPVNHQPIVSTVEDLAGSPCLSLLVMSGSTCHCLGKQESFTLSRDFTSVERPDIPQSVSVRTAPAEICG